MKKLHSLLFGDKKIVFIGIILFIINYFMVLKLNIRYVESGGHSIFKYSIAILLILEFLSIFLLNYFFKNKKPIEKVFITFASILGIMYMVLMPIGSVPDENNHFLRSYEISTGHLIGVKKGNEVGNYLPTNIESALIYKNGNRSYKNELDNFKVRYNKEKKFYNFANTSLYSFVSYLPQTIGVLLGRLLNLPILITAYLGRICNFLLWLFIMFFSIKKIPVGKKIVFLIALLPMSIQEAVSLAPDAMTNCISIALVSYVLFHIYDKNKLSNKSKVIGSLLCVAISLLKIVYLPLCLLVLLIPKEKFKSTKDKYINIGMLACIVVFLNLLWLKISSNFLIEFMPGVDSAKQTSFILSHPYRYLTIIFTTYEYNLPTYIYTMLGSNLEWLNVYVSQPYLLVMLFLIFYVAIFDNSIELKRNVKYMFSFVAICILLLISTSLYVQWTAYKSFEIAGIQGRYFLPILLPCLLLLNNKNIKYKNFSEKEVLFVSISLNIYVILLLLYTHIL